MGSEAPCCGGGLSGNCQLIIHFIFNPQIQYFLHFPKIVNISLSKFYTLKTSEKSSENSQITKSLQFYLRIVLKEALA